MCVGGDPFIGSTSTSLFSPKQLKSPCSSPQISCITHPGISMSIGALTAIEVVGGGLGV